MKKEKPVIRNKWDRIQVQSLPVGESKAQQNMAAACDINNIMKKYEKTGLIEHVKQNGGSYGDFSKVEDFHSALNQVNEAMVAFGTLSAQLRSRFENDPAQLIEFLSNKKNYDEAVELGLIEKPVEKRSTKKPSPSPTEPSIPAEPEAKSE